jgi:hypothetical protein
MANAQEQERTVLETVYGMPWSAPGIVDRVGPEVVEPIPHFVQNMGTGVAKIYSPDFLG